MPRVHGKDLGAVNVADSGGTLRNLRNETIAINFQVGVQTHDTTTFGDQWVEFTSGLRGGDEFTHECLYENATNNTWLVYSGRINTGNEGSFSFTDGTRTVTMNTIVTQLSLPMPVNDMLKITATHKITGPVTFS